MYELRLTLTMAMLSSLRVARSMRRIAAESGESGMSTPPPCGIRGIAEGVGPR
jgi:hypothetical protein